MRSLASAPGSARHVRFLTGFLGPGWSGDPAAAAAILDAMGGAIRHRGPDTSGQWIDRETRLGFAHARPAIVDLSRAACTIVRWYAPKLVPLSIGLTRLFGPWAERLVPVQQYADVFPLPHSQDLDWAVPDTFDALSPSHDHPQNRRDRGALVPGGGL